MSVRQSKAQLDRQLTLKQQRFVRDYARHGNGTKAAKKAGYKGSDETLAQVSYENLRKPEVAAAADLEIDRIDREIAYDAGRVRRRLDALSHGAERAEQYATAVRAEELIGRAAGMFIDQSITLRGDLSADHLAALVEVARQRQAQPIELARPSDRKRLIDG